ncbi:MAG: replication restart helicase PriA [Candidatus Scatomorpha sp.]|jgi:primosomal protein N' (replication factor Y)
MQNFKFAKLAISGIPYSLDKPFDYYIPQSLESTVQIGSRVLVPFSKSNRKTEGIILYFSKSSDIDEKKLKPILSVLDEHPLISEQQVKLALWMHDRFFCTVYDALKAMLPVGIFYNTKGINVKEKTKYIFSLNISTEEAKDLAVQKKRRSPKQALVLGLLSDFEKVSQSELRQITGASTQTINALLKSGLINREEQRVFRRPEIKNKEAKEPFDLSPDQSKIYFQIKEDIANEKLKLGLLQGVTGSGKTAIYIKLISDVINAGKSAIFLLPEIALTPQMLETFYSYFGDKVALLHSSLTQGERYDEWDRVKNREALIVIGTRSAVFAPTENLGIIIIDEEQEESYHSENAPRYDTVDVAMYRAHQSGAPLILGSATPGVATRYFAEVGRFKHYVLDSRFNEQSLPQVHIVDMKKELKKGNGSNISFYLRDEISKNIEAGEQTILFLNRRGANKLIVCGECGRSYECPNCSVNLSYHSFGNKLLCHHCGYRQKPDECCPHCGGILKYVGAGTQKLEEEIKELFPDIDILRMDADAVSFAGSHYEILDSFIRNRTPILIGTQMVTKGLNFENVTLVGVILADQGLFYPSYRASERSFSLITQVIGRSGRFSKKGRAVIQTFTPENDTIVQAAAQNYEAFYREEIQLRKFLNLPPFSEIIAICCEGRNEKLVLNCANDIKNELNHIFANDEDINIYGPAQLPVFKLNNVYRYRLNIRFKNIKNIRPLLANIIKSKQTDKKFSAVSIYAENNPLD